MEKIFHHDEGAQSPRKFSGRAPGPSLSLKNVQSVQSHLDVAIIINYQRIQRIFVFNHCSEPIKFSMHLGDNRSLDYGLSTLLMLKSLSAIIDLK